MAIHHSHPAHLTKPVPVEEWVFMGFCREDIPAFSYFKVAGMRVWALEEIVLGAPVFVSSDTLSAVCHDPKTGWTLGSASPEVQPNKTYIDKYW